MRETTVDASGTVSSQGRFYSRFDALVLLSALQDVLLRRIERRTTNDFGKRPGERAQILADMAEAEPLLGATCTHQVNATQPLDVVVERLVESGRGARDWSRRATISREAS